MLHFLIVARKLKAIFNRLYFFSFFFLFFRSFDIILWQIITDEQKPYRDLEIDQLKEHVAVKQRKPVIPSEFAVPKQILDIYDHCSSFYPASRYPAQRILKILESISLEDFYKEVFPRKQHIELESDESALLLLGDNDDDDLDLDDMIKDGSVIQEISHSGENELTVQELFDKAEAHHKAHEFARARDLYSQCLERENFPLAAYRLGEYYLSGQPKATDADSNAIIVIEKNVQRALQYLNESAKGECDPATDLLGFMLLEGREGIPAAPERGVKLLMEAADRRYAWAFYHLSRAYRKGLGVPRDSRLAQKSLQDAADLGLKAAKDALATMVERRERKNP